MPAIDMAASVFHQRSLPTASPWTPLNSTYSLPALPRRRRAPAIRSVATDSSVGAGAGESPPSRKRTTRKEKQQERRRQHEVEQRQEQLLMMEASPAAAKGGGGEEYDDDELPQPVFDRIVRRTVFTVGGPMASGVALLNVYGELERDHGVDVPSWLPLLTILVGFGTSALGIAYGTLSASWDPDKEGSLLGIDEARANWPVLWKEEIEKKAKKQKKK